MINKEIEKSATKIFEIVLEKVIVKDEEISLDDWKMKLFDLAETLSETHAIKIIKKIGFTKEKRFPTSQFKQKIMNEVIKKILIRQHGGKYD
tara:strand:- start:278 stop:553 length:276 start_codon:yes stop_codon:yes gene_type:complete